MNNAPLHVYLLLIAVVLMALWMWTCSLCIP